MLRGHCTSRCTLAGGNTCMSATSSLGIQRWSVAPENKPPQRLQAERIDCDLYEHRRCLCFSSATSATSETIPRNTDCPMGASDKAWPITEPALSQRRLCPHGCVSDIHQAQAIACSSIGCPKGQLCHWGSRATMHRRKSGVGAARTYQPQRSGKFQWSTQSFLLIQSDDLLRSLPDGSQHQPASSHITLKTKRSAR